MRDSKQIVVVEDDASMRQAIERLLRAAGWEPRLFNSAETLLDLGSGKDAACFVINLELPGISGFELRARLRELGINRPIFFTTTYDHAGARNEAERVSAGYFPKPFDGQNLIRAITRVLATLVLLAATFVPVRAIAEEEHAQRVLVVHSFGNATPPFSSEAMAFENELVEKMGKQVDLGELSLDMAHYADPDMQEAIVESLEKQQLKWHPDIVATIGSPAARFIAKYRERLFPETPIVYAALDRRLLPPGALEENATYVGLRYDIPGLLEDMLQVAPETKNIAVVIGATPLEQYWKDAFKEAAAPWSDRIKFVYWDHLSFDQMLDKAKVLPPNSYIFFLLLLRDAVGVTHNADKALQRLHAVANAPINSIFDQQLGMGIVGGRLYPNERFGREAASIVVRILHGEAASSFKPKLIERLPARYDWRELHRWNIDEKQLPPGSTISYRTPTVWKQYRGWIIVGGSICIAEGLLIAMLLANLFRRRNAEHSLSESEGRFRNMADAAPVMIWTAGLDKRRTFVNKAWLNFTGRTMEQELGDGWSEVVHSDDLENCWRTYVGAFNARRPFAMQYKLRRHDGEYRLITDNGMPRHDRRGNFLGYVGVCLDITDMLEKDKVLHEFEERVALAAETAHLGVWELHTITKDFWISDKARELFQFDSKTQISWEQFRNRIYPEDRALCDTAVRRAIEDHSSYEIEYRILLPDGTVRWIGGRARCVGDETGKPTRLLGVSMDITERKQAQELFRFATEASPSGIVLADEDGVILLVNAHIEELFGYHRDELIGKSVEILMPDRFIKRHRIGREKFMTAPGSRTLGGGGELFARRKDGSEFPFEVTLTPIQTAHGSLVLASMIDISARKRADQEAKSRREQIDLLSRVSLLGEMTASIAHELNQPLSAIVSNANAGTRFIEQASFDPAMLREILLDVAEDGHRAHNIIHNIRNTIKKGGAIRQAVSLNEVVNKVVHMVHPDATMNSCQIRTSLADDLPRVDVDPVQIQQVLINLVGNAFHAMRETQVADRKVEIITSRNGNGAIEVSVRDHGAGISEESQKRLFEHFFTTREDGLGMGLAIVRSIIEAHGGKIHGENVKGGGARFYFHLPISKAA